jgi:prophage regulatory protein
MTAETFLRIRDVGRITGLPTSSIYELMAKGKFPRQVRLGPQRVCWVEAEILEWQRERIAERDEAAA